MYILTALCGYHVEIEIHTNKSRMDMTVKTKDHIYIFEFKFNKSAEEALAQINEKGYAEPFRNDGRSVVKVDVNFSKVCRSFDMWVVE